MIEAVLALAGFTLLWGSSQGLGLLFLRFRLPKFAGEILGGGLMGAATRSDFFRPLGLDPFFSKSLIDYLGQWGLLLLMFYSGKEMRSKFKRMEWRPAMAFSFGGLVLAGVGAVLLLPFLDLSALIGEKKDLFSVSLILVASTAVTSIPVISRIFLDLGLAHSRFARLCLSSAVIEDIIVYGVVTAFLFKMDFQLLKVLDSPLVWGAFTVFLILAAKGPVFIRRVIRLALIPLFGLGLGLPAFMVALLLGVAIGTRMKTPEQKPSLFRRFSFLFFIPFYFGTVGFKIHVGTMFSISLLIGLLLFSSGLKLAGVYIAARLTKLNHQLSFAFGVTLNARGGPGIVLATVALEEKWINEGFHLILVLIALITSFIAGVSLERFAKSQSYGEFEAIES
jgi:Kef-type K+ transport system membrane component KefB